MDNSNLEEALMRKFDFESCRYFYHITSHGNGENIVENGLLLEEPELNSTTIEFDKDMIDNIAEYIKNEYRPDSVMQREEMVILGCDKEHVSEMIQKNAYYFDLDYAKDFDYIVPSNFIMGYVDLKTLEFTENELFEYSKEYYHL